MKDSRLRKLTLEVKMCIESDVEVENTKFLRLDFTKDKKNEPMGIQNLLMYSISEV